MDALAFLVDDRIHCNRSFTRLAVTDDQFPLPAPDRHHGIDRFNSCLKRSIYGFS